MSAVDERSLKQKLEDMERLGTPGEQAAARQALARLGARQRPDESDSDPLVAWLKAQPSQPRSGRTVRLSGAVYDLEEAIELFGRDYIRRAVGLENLF